MKAGALDIAAGCSILNVLFCRAFPGLSRCWYDAMGEDLAGEVDD